MGKSQAGESNAYRLNPYEETESILRLLSLKLDVPKAEVHTLLYSMHQEEEGEIYP